MRLNVAGHNLEVLLDAGYPVKFLKPVSDLHSGDQTLIKREENYRINLSTEAQARVFDLSNEKDMKDYNEIVKRVGRGISAISAEERHWDESKKNFIIFLRWCDYIIEIP